MKEGAPLRAKAVPSKVRAYGPGLEPTGVVAKENQNHQIKYYPYKSIILQSFKNQQQFHKNL